MSTRSSMIGLLVKDMERSLGFYRALGLEIPKGAEEEPHVEVEIGDGVVLFWDAVFVGTYHPDRNEPKGGYRVLLEFFVGNKEDVDARYKELVVEGHRARKAPFETHFGAYMAMIDDPDGNTILLTAG